MMMMGGGGGAGAQPNEKIFVGDIPLGADEHLMREIFKAYGNVVDVKVLPARTPGAKGAALIKFGTVDEAAWVVENLNGNIPQNLAEPVFVAFARPSVGGGGFAKGGGGGGFGPARNDWSQPAAAPYGGAPAASDKVFVGDVPQHFDEGQLRSLFGQYATVADVKMLPPRTAGEKGAALVRLSSPAEAKGVVDALNGQIPPGVTEPLYVQFAKSPSGGGQGAFQPPSAAGKGQSFFTLPGLAGAPGPRAGAAGGWKGGGFGAKGGGAGMCDIQTVTRSIYKSNILPGAGDKPDANTILIKGIPRDTTDLDLYKIFSPLGAIAVNGVKAMLAADGSCKGCGFVDFVDAATASMAVAAFGGYVLPDGSPLIVELRPPSKPKGAAAH